MRNTKSLLRTLAFFWLFIPCLVFASPKVVVKGLEARLGSNASESVASNITLHLGHLTQSVLDNQRLLSRRIQTAVKKGANALGLYHVQHSFQLEGQFLTISLDEFVEVSWATIDIQVEDEASEALRAIVRSVRFEKGARIDHSEYDSFKRNLHQSALRQGFLDAVYTRSQLEIDLSNNTADLRLHLKVGQRYKVDTINFEGSSIDLHVLNVLSPLKQGDWHSATKLAELNNALLDSGYFSFIDIDVERLTDSATTRILVNLQDSPSNRFTTGIGFGTDTGPRVKFGWGKPHVGSRGHSFSSESQLSAISQSLSSEYRIPYPHPLNRYLSWSTGYKQEQLEDTENQIFNIGLSLNILTENHWRMTYGLDLEYEKYEQGSQAEEEVTYLIPNAAWSRTLLKGDAIDPDGGIKYWLNVDASSEALGSDTDFIRARTGLRWLYEIVPEHRLLARMELGAVATSELEELPSSKRFFTGGDQSIRGYAFKKVAPIDANGELEGGRFLNTASLEYAWRFVPKWQVAIFSDVGRAYNQTSTPFKHSAGFGIRWLTPISQISLDVAWPLDDPEKDHPRFHLYMGPAL